MFVVAWFAGLFYLPRLFVYHAAATDAPGLERFITMERRLFAIMTLGAALAAVFGMSMILAAPEYLAAGWLRVKLVLVAVLLGYHIWCYRLMVALRSGWLCPCGSTAALWAPNSWIGSSVGLKIRTIR